MVNNAEKAVKAELRDPGSAKFSDVGRCGASEIVTGKVNAKNKYGAFSGDMTFYYDGSAVVPINATEDGPFSEGLFGLPSMESQTATIEACTTAIVAGMDPAARMQFEKEKASSDVAISNDSAIPAVNVVNNADGTDNASENTAAADDSTDGDTDGEGAAIVTNAVRTNSQYPNNCYKDYCPCEPPQGGPDSILCDELEAGQDVDINLMIAGKGFRETRRQIAEDGYPQ